MRWEKQAISPRINRRPVNRAQLVPTPISARRKILFGIPFLITRKQENGGLHKRTGLGVSGLPLKPVAANRWRASC